MFEKCLRSFRPKWKRNLLAIQRLKNWPGCCQQKGSESKKAAMASPGGAGHAQALQKSYEVVVGKRFVSTRLAATLLADGAPCFAICAFPALVIKRDCSYISIPFSLEIAEMSLPIASSGKSSGDSK